MPTKKPSRKPSKSPKAPKAKKTAAPVKKAKKKIAKTAKVVRKVKARVKAPAPKDLKKEVLDWIRANPGSEVAHAAMEKFDVTYDHLKGWVVKESEQVRDAVENLIKRAPNKKELQEKGGKNFRI